jgi:hypothetical protein
MFYPPMPPEITRNPKDKHHTETKLYNPITSA